MAPLALLNDNQEIQDEWKIEAWFNKLQQGNVDGVMIDVWWGLVEQSPKVYKWTGYAKIFKMLKDRNLKIVPVMSFHKCGGNVGDECNIPLPEFILKSSVQPFFKDQFGNIDAEYISFGYDNVEIEGRTPLKMYRDYMEAFHSEFKDYIDSHSIVEIEIGVGPCGELRYPSYQSHLWSYPGCGNFIAYDEKLTEILKKDAEAEGRSNYGHHPYNTGDYNVRPGGSAYWNEGTSDGWKSDYGLWYSKWYSRILYQHGANVFKDAREVFGTTHLSSKIAGIHWWYMVPCHCAEATAGFSNYQFYDGYRDILTEFKKYDIDCCFTCLEMTEDGSAGSNPPYLVSQIIGDSKWAGLRFEGENALACYDWNAFMRIKNWVSQGLSTFTYLRLCDTLMQDNNWNTFTAFVNELHNT